MQTRCSTGLLDALLETPLASRVRRNHGLEHATIHVITGQRPRRLFGHSDAGGFWLWGQVSTQELEAAVFQALTRLRAGEHHLAVHPNCGTNFATAGVAAGLAGALAMFGAEKGWRRRLERLPLAAALATLALILTRPLGNRIQERVTTSGVPGDLEVVEIVPVKRGRWIGHRVVTRG